MTAAPARGLRQWDVVRVRFRATDRDRHPAVVISNDEICADARVGRVNVLHGTKTAPGNPPRIHQALLNSADGLEFLTAMDCAYLYSIAKSEITEHLGTVSLERRRILKRTIIAAHRLL